MKTMGSKSLKSWYLKLVYFQDRSAILASPPSPSERSGEGEGGDAKIALLS